MSPDSGTDNVQRTVPLLCVTSMETSLQFYVGGLGFEITDRWVVDGAVRWCWLEHGGAAILLQEGDPDDQEASPLARGVGVEFYFVCRDALAFYHELSDRGVAARRPFVGNGMWVTSVADPDGYDLHFESLTDVPEGAEADG